MSRQGTGAMAPCFFPARLHVADRVHRVSITRIGGNAAQLYGGPVVAEGSQARLEFDRPTDGERIMLEIEVLRVLVGDEASSWIRTIVVRYLQRIHVADVRAAGRAAPAAVTEPLDRKPIALEPLTISLDDAMEDDPPGGGTPTLPPRMTMAEAQAIARGVVDLDAARRAAPREGGEGSLPARYGSPVARRVTAITPWDAELSSLVEMFPREPRILSNSPVSYLTSGRHRTGAVQDFSQHGMFLAVLAGDPLPAVGATIRVDFPVPADVRVFIVGMMAEVRWIHGGDGATAEGRGAGLLVSTFDQAAGREAYERYVDSLLAAKGLES